jgi:hypothetical protein
MDGDDNASLPSMLPKTRLSPRNTDFPPHKANDMPELPGDLVLDDASRASLSRFLMSSIQSQTV